MESSDPKVVDFYTRREHLQEKMYRLRTFGALIGLRFIENFGVAEVSMGYPEVSRLLQVVKDAEKEKSQPNTSLLNAIDTVQEYIIENIDYSVIAEVVIGSGRIDIIPDYDDRKRSNSQS